MLRKLWIEDAPASDIEWLSAREQMLKQYRAKLNELRALNEEEFDLYCPQELMKLEELVNFYECDDNDDCEE